MLENLGKELRRLPCKVRNVLENLDESDREIFANALADTKKWQTRTLANEMTKLGVPISDTPILKHRNQMCSCFKN